MERDSPSIGSPETNRNVSPHTARWRCGHAIGYTHYFSLRLNQASIRQFPIYFALRLDDFRSAAFAAFSVSSS
jgi:hypothetical protein